MNAIVNVRHDAAALVRHADHYDACDDFHGNVGDVLCAGCGQHFTDHVVVALRGQAAQSCGTCAHSNADDACEAGLTFCRRAGAYYNGRLMQMSARCDMWKAGHE